MTASKLFTEFFAFLALSSASWAACEACRVLKKKKKRAQKNGCRDYKTVASPFHMSAQAVRHTEPWLLSPG